MQIFGTIYIAPIEASVESPGVHITQYNNFANFPQALLLMTRLVECASNINIDNGVARGSGGSSTPLNFFGSNILATIIEPTANLPLVNGYWW